MDGAQYFVQAHAMFHRKHKLSQNLWLLTRESPMKHVKKIDTTKSSDKNDKKNKAQSKSSPVREVKDVYGCSIEIM